VVDVLKSGIEPFAKDILSRGIAIAIFILGQKAAEG
jgi:hypothetical protein